jgi:MoaA/NifB/PqqE/SkfB family radical SAM enzyme
MRSKSILQGLVERVVSQRKMEFPPNTLLTNYCNQNCSYCFAKEEMIKSKVKEMSLVNFKRLVEILKKNDIHTLRLMGGEPTLHTKFKDIIKIGVKNFKNILVFTNGLIPAENFPTLKKNIKKISFNFNLNTPAFEKSESKREKIIRLIKEFSKKTKVNVGFTLSDLNKDYRKLFKDFDGEVLSKIGVRFGFAKAIVGQEPFFAKKDYKKLGKKIVKLVKFFKNRRKREIFLDCGLKKEMFGQFERTYLLQNVSLRGWGCEGKWSSFDIAPDLTIFPCFPYYLTNKRRRLSDFKTFRDIRIFLKRRKTCNNWQCEL